jgi:hypothetical protein
MFCIAVETLEDWGELTDDVGKGQELFVELIAARFTEPHKSVEFIRDVSLALDHQSDRVCWTLRGVWCARGQEEDLTLLDMDVARLAIIDDLYGDVTLDLIEKLLALVIVVILAIVRSTHHHNDELRVLVHLCISHGRLEKVTVLVDPGMEIEGALDRHAKLTQTIGVVDS